MDTCTNCKQTFLLCQCPDLIPEVGYSEMHWWIMNRLAEHWMRYLRILGLI